MPTRDSVVMPEDPLHPGGSLDPGAEKDASGSDGFMLPNAQFPEVEQVSVLLPSSNTSLILTWLPVKCAHRRWVGQRTCISVPLAGLVLTANE